MDIQKYNQQAWDRQVSQKNKWTLPVSAEEIARARSGDFQIVLTPKKTVPADWFPVLSGCKVLCLAGGGGQQAPILAAAGAEVTVLDNSPRQLEQDQLVAERDCLEIKTVEGDMRDLSVFADGAFDFIFHPCSNTFIPGIQPVWNEAYRVLRSGGTMISGMCNPVIYIFDYDQYKQGEFVVRHSIPYSDLEQLTEEELQQLKDDGEPFCFGHTIEDQIGGQTAAGFHITGFYEDYWGDDKENLLDKIMPGFFATRALKP